MIEIGSAKLQNLSASEFAILSKAMTVHAKCTEALLAPLIQGNHFLPLSYNKPKRDISLLHPHPLHNLNWYIIEPCEHCQVIQSIDNN